MISSIISRLVILIFGTLYPAYASYKAVRTKNLKEYVKWMMYWIVFALFTCMETFTDVFLSWFPFYYEVKIVLVLWLLSPATKGSSILYRKFVHPALCRREQEIDEYIAKAKDQGYHTVLNLGTKGVNYATTVIMQTAIKGGGGLVQQIRKSYSLSDLTECDPRDERGADEADDVMAEPQLIRRNVVGRSGVTTRRSTSESNTRSAIYFSEVDVDVRSPRARADEPDFSHIKSTEDISSGYSSADNSGASLARTGSVGARMRPRAGRTAVTAIKRPQAAEDSEVIIEELQEDDSFEYSNMPALMNVPSPLFLSHSEPPFIYQYVGDQIRIVQVLGDHPFNSNIFRNKDLKDNLNSTDSKDQPGTSSKVDIKLETAEVMNDSKEVFEEAEFDNAVEQNEVLDKPVTEMNVSDKVSENIDPNNNDTKTEILELENKNDTNVTQPPAEENNDKIENNVSIPVEVTIPIKTEENPTSQVKDTVPLSEEEAIAPDTSPNDNESDSDDEASFGTPENSPKSKRKSPRGRYGKGKAPPPPAKVETDNVEVELDKTSNLASLTTSQESLAEILQTLPNTSFKETGTSNTLVVNPIAEKKRRHKSKSPGRIPKSSGTTIGKLLQIPSKLAFWQKDKNKGDNLSTSSGDHSRRSSTYEKVEDFQSCSELNKIIPLVANDSNTNEVEKSEDQISFKDASDTESEMISHDLMEKSDALQKLIEAKRQSHPEYKYTNLEDEIPTTSKSTEV